MIKAMVIRRPGLRHRAALACESGFTLIEVLVVMIVLLIVLVPLTGAFVSASNAELDSVARADDQQAARQTLARMRTDIHCASGATVQPTATGYLLNLTETASICQGVTTASSGVQWCSASVGGSTTRYAVYRTVTGTCQASSAVFQVDYVTNGNIWSLPTCSTGQFPTVAINMPVNRDIATHPGQTYHLTDTIALRNANVCP
jgi:prepilin-type N-terminal cleavage/methylation domain-containing protein